MSSICLVDVTYKDGQITMIVSLWCQNKIGNNDFVIASDALSCVVIAWRRMRSICTQSRREKFLMPKW